MRFLDDEYWTYENSSYDTSRSWVTTSPLGRWKILAMIITTILILITVMGNGMTLYAVCKMKKFQNSISNLYIASLASADFIVGSLVMTLSMIYTMGYDGRWPFGPIVCDIWQSIDLISCTISLYSICAIGFDRWLNLEKPLRIFKRNRLTAKRALAFVWIGPILIWTPLMIAIRSKNGHPSDDTCTFVWKPTYLVLLVAVPFFYIPAFTLIVLFVRISLVIRSHLVFLHKHSNQNNTSISIFDLDRSIGASSPFGSTPASSRRRSATPLGGSLVSLKLNGTNSIGFNANANLGGMGNCRLQKWKPPALSPIASVNVTAMFNSSGQTTKEGSGTGTGPGISECDQNSTMRGPNQSPLAMKVLRDRLSPKLSNKRSDEKKHSQQSENSPLSESGGNDHLVKPKSKLDGANETTPLLNANYCKQSKMENPKLIRVSTLEIEESPKIEKKTSCPVTFQIGTGEWNENSQTTRKESGNIIKPDQGDNKRSSVTSDTALFFTKRFLNQKPQLVRAKTEVILEMNRRLPRTSARFSVISIASPLFSRKYSMNIFSEMFPQCAGNITQQIRAAKAVGIIMVFFLISWTPFLVLWPLKVFCSDCVSHRWYQLSIWANYLNSTINPALYTLCSPRFQRVFRKHCSGCPIVGRIWRDGRNRKQFAHCRRKL